MIRISNLKFSYPNTSSAALQVPKLIVPGGSFTLVSGVSGCGKSTLLRLTNGLVPHFSGGNLQGSIKVFGQNPVEVGPQVMSSSVGFVFQEPENQFVTEVVEDEIAFAMENMGVPQQEMKHRIDDLLELLNITNLKKRKLENLSGGEAQRVAIASAMALTPKMIVLDEPTSQLDPLTAEKMLKRLNELRKSRGMTILIAEQRLERVLPFTDYMVHINPHGHDCLSGNPRDVIRKTPLQSPLVQVAIRKKWTPIPLSIAEAKKFTDAEKDSKSYIEEVVDVEKEVLSVDDLQVSYPNHPVLEDINFRIMPKERVVIMGPNGVGKSTLLRSIVNLVKAQSGSIRINGIKTDQRSTADISKQTGFLPQDPSALLFAETVQDELEVTLKNHKFPIDRNWVSRLLHELYLNEKKDHYPRDLSTGERQRTALGAVCITRPGLLLLDEPTRGLDAISKGNLLDLLHEWNYKGMTILLVTHDVEFAASFASRVILLKNGKIIANGNPKKILHSYHDYSPQIAQLYPNTNWLTVSDALIDC